MCTDILKKGAKHGPIVMPGHQNARYNTRFQRLSPIHGGKGH
jgi:hypothetical protein